MPVDCKGYGWSDNRWKPESGPLHGLRDCDYDGGIHPADALALLATGDWHLGFTDKGYKAYLEHNTKSLPGPPAKVYWYHFTEDERKRMLAFHQAQGHACTSPRRWQNRGNWDTRYSAIAHCTACRAPRPSDLIAAIKAGKVRPFATHVEKASEHGDHAVFIEVTSDNGIGSMLVAELSHCTPEEWATLSDIALASQPVTSDDVRRSRDKSDPGP